MSHYVINYINYNYQYTHTNKHKHEQYFIKLIYNDNDMIVFDYFTIIKYYCIYYLWFT